MINVVNKKSGASGIYVGRGSPLGNPFKIGADGSRDEVIAKYEVYLKGKIEAKDGEVCSALNTVWKGAKSGDVSLVCFCAPLRCHGEVIRRVVEEKLG